MRYTVLRDICDTIAERATHKIQDRLQCSPVEAENRFHHALDSLFPITADPPVKKRHRLDKRLKSRFFRPASVAEVRAVFYQIDGHVYLRVRDKGRPAGTEVGSRGRTGLYTVYLDGYRFPRSHIVFALVHGCWPRHAIFHINFDRSDDRVANLAEATHAEICRSTKVSTHNAYGVKGVTSPKPRANTGTVRYTAAIQRNGVSRRLGSYKTPAEAHLAYCRAAAECHGYFNPASNLYDDAE